MVVTYLEISRDARKLARTLKNIQKEKGKKKKKERIYTKLMNKMSQLLYTDSYTKIWKP